MENVNVEGLGNIDKVKDLFSSVKGLEDDNCFLVVLNRDYVDSSIDPSSTLTSSATRVGGIVGGVAANSFNNAVAEAVNEFNSKLNDKQKIVFSRNVYSGFLINITNKGIGVIPLTNNGKLIPNIKYFVTDIDNYIFIENNEIEKVKIEKLPLHFSSRKLAIYFKELGNVGTPWTLPMKHKLISYQEENYKKLASKLS